jgi:hypothetical protein
MTSIAPLRVAGLMEFHAVDTESLRFLTYCMVQQSEGPQAQARATTRETAPVERLLEDIAASKGDGVDS